MHVETFVSRGPPVCTWKKSTGDATLGRQTCYLESVSAADVVVGLDRGDDVTGQGDAAEHRLLSAVWRGSKDSRAQGRNDKPPPQTNEGDMIHVGPVSVAGTVAACGTGWHGAYLLFSVINGAGAAASATQAWITPHNKILRLIRTEKWEGENSQ